MQIPDVVQYFDLGARGAALVVLTYLSIQVHDMKQEFGRRLARLEGLHMHETGADDQPGNGDT